jgi:hypothetical protein
VPSWAMDYEEAIGWELAADASRALTRILEPPLWVAGLREARGIAASSPALSTMRRQRSRYFELWES